LEDPDLKRIRFARSGFEEDPVEIARKKPPPLFPRPQALLKRPTKTPGKGESSQKKPKTN
jgi:hypothetical protein